MKHYIVKIANLADGTTKKAIYEFDDYDSSLASFHNTLGTDIKDENCLSTCLHIQTSNGQILKQEYWQKTPTVATE